MAGFFFTIIIRFLGFFEGSSLRFISFILGPCGVLASESSSGFVSSSVLSICVGIHSDSVALLRP